MVGTYEVLDHRKAKGYLQSQLCLPDWLALDEVAQSCLDSWRAHWDSLESGKETKQEPLALVFAKLVTEYTKVLLTEEKKPADFCHPIDSWAPK